MADGLQFYLKKYSIHVKAKPSLNFRLLSFSALSLTQDVAHIILF